MVHINMGSSPVIAVCEQRADLRTWRLHSSTCELVADGGGSCVACSSEREVVRHVAKRLVARRDQISDDFVGFAETHRVGDGLISRLSMSELQIACQSLWARSDLHDDKDSYRSSRRTDRKSTR